MENLAVINGIETPAVSVSIMPAVISTNYEALDQAITQIADSYKVIQYSDDAEMQLKQMKEDRAKLNKLSKAVNDEKIRIKKEASKEITVFEDDFKKLIAKIADPVEKIDAGIKEIEEKNREEKKALAKKIFDEAAFSVDENDREKLYSMIFEEKFLNVTTTIKYIRENIMAGIRKYVEGINALNAIDSDFKTEGIDQFKGDLDLPRAMETVNRLQKQKEEAEERIRAQMEAEKQAAIREAEERVRREEQQKAEEARRIEEEKRREEQLKAEEDLFQSKTEKTFPMVDDGFPYGFEDSGDFGFSTIPVASAEPETSTDFNEIKSMIKAELPEDIEESFELLLKAVIQYVIRNNSSRINGTARELLRDIASERTLSFCFDEK